MPCFRRNRRSRSENSEPTTLNEENDNGTLQKVWRRVSFLSSTIIRYLRDIRDDIFKLLGLQDVVSEKYRSFDDSEKLTSHIFRKDCVDKSSQSLASGDSPRIRRKRFSDTIKFDVKNESNSSARSELGNIDEKINSQNIKRDVSEAIRNNACNDLINNNPVQLYEIPEKELEECRNIDIQKEVDVSKNPVNKGKNAVRSEKSQDGITYDFDVKTVLSQFGAESLIDEKQPLKNHDHSWDCNVQIFDGDLIVIQKQVNVFDSDPSDKKSATNSKPETSKMMNILAGSPFYQNNPTYTQPASKQTDDPIDNTASGDKSSLTKAEDFQLYADPTSTSKATDCKLADLPQSKLEKRRTPCKPVSQTSKQVISTGALSPPKVTEGKQRSSLFGGARSKTKKKPKEIPEGGVIVKDKRLIKKLEKLFRREIAKKPSETGPMVQLTLDDSSDEEDEPITPEERVDILITDRQHLEANRDRLVAMIHMVVKHCIVAFAERHYKYHMTIEVNLMFTETNRMDGARAGTDKDNAVSTVKFDRRFTLEPYLGQTLVNHTAEQIRPMLAKVVLDTRLNNVPLVNGQITNENELCWCTSAIDVLTYICYYVLIGRNKILEKIHDENADVRQRTVLVRALHDHVVQKFDISIVSLMPRMYHAVENFSLNFDYEPFPAVPEHPSDNPAETAQNPGKPLYVKSSTKKKKKNRSARRAKSKFRKSQEAANTSQNTSLDTSGIDVDGEVTDTSNLVAYNDDTPDVDTSLLLEDGDEGLEQIIELNEDITDDVIVDVNDLSAVENDVVVIAGASDISDNDVDDMQTMLAADIDREIDWDFGDYVTYIETNNTLDYSCLEVVAGHGETPNKKKICEEIKEKKKTKGIPNKHLEKPKPTEEVYNAYDDVMDEVEDVNDNATDGSTIMGDIEEMLDNEKEGTDKEKEIVELPEQVIDDREFNFVPEEVLRKEESKLKDLEDAFIISSSEKKKDNHKKKKEKRPKAVKKLQLDFTYSDSDSKRYRH